MNLPVKQYLFFMILALAMFNANVLPQAGKQLHFDDLAAVRVPESMALSPDGSKLVYTLAENNAAGTTTNRTLIKVDIKTRGSIPFLAAKINAHSPKWSPDGRYVAFISNDSGGTSQLWISDDKGADASQLTNESPVTSFEWSPVRNEIAYVSRSRTARSSVIVEGTSPHTELLFKVSLEPRKIDRLTPEPGSSIGMSWSPKGDSIVYSAQASPGFYGGFESDLFIYDLKNDQLSRIVSRPGMDKNPKWSPDGKYIAFLSNYGKAGGLLPNIGLSVLSVADNRINDLGQKLDKGGFFEGPNKLVWSSDSKYIFYSLIYEAGARIIRADISQQTVSVFSDGKMTTDDVNTSGQKNLIVFRSSNFRTPPDVYITSTDRFEPIKVTDLNPQIRQINLPTGEVIKWKSQDGAMIDGLLVRPANFDPNKKYPLLVLLHGGPATSYTDSFPVLDFFNPLREELLAANGYVVIAPNFRGSGGYGYEFRASIKNDWGTLPFQDVMSGVDHLVGKGFIDGERLGVMGWSYGGYLAALTVTRTNRFKAAAVGAGVTDLFGHFGKLPEQMLEYYSGHPWESLAKENYEKSSPMSHVNKIKTPTLIIHGENDTAVSISQAEQLLAALRTLGVESQFVRYVGQGHSFFSDARKESFERVIRWFDGKLKK